MVKNNPDIVIVGAGHAGLTQTLLLALSGFNVACIDPTPVDLAQDGKRDGRTTALSYGSMQVMKAAGVWDRILPHACAIQDIQILDGSSPVLLNFLSEDLKQEISNPAFGWVVENHVLRHVLHQAIQEQKNATLIFGQNVTDFEEQETHMNVFLSDGQQLSAKLVIGADGRSSFTRKWAKIPVREWSYNQQALVCMVTHEKPHQNIAVEHFKSEGPFAILPMLGGEQGQHRSALVWTKEVKSHQKNPLLSYDKKTFITALNARFPEFYGGVTNIGKRMSYPLNLIHAYRYTAPRIALVADAAHGIHPIAGQGLNLGLRDVATLCEILVQARESEKDIGLNDVLKTYERARRFDNTAMAATTDILNKLFGSEHLMLPFTRKVGLKMVERFLPAKKFFMRQAMGTAGLLPDMIKTGKLKS
ncbi:MAG: UbiH/UbiF/VisC/COQ6 family ubiquinone biosynthesis hydroxylase [Alphaproteobacteria bacterium]|nr:UbiH/UbiF/VisC/COQ6 family ubiquinone biosynthesis hydroxylase [Alphaproteobacteria bacterium]